MLQQYLLFVSILFGAAVSFAADPHGTQTQSPPVTSEPSGKIRVSPMMAMPVNKAPFRAVSMETVSQPKKPAAPTAEIEAYVPESFWPLMGQYANDERFNRLYAQWSGLHHNLSPEQMALMLAVDERKGKVDGGRLDAAICKETDTLAERAAKREDFPMYEKYTPPEFRRVLARYAPTDRRDTLLSAPIAVGRPNHKKTDLMNHARDCAQAWFAEPRAKQLMKYDNMGFCYSMSIAESGRAFCQMIAVNPANAPISRPLVSRSTTRTYSTVPSTK